MGDRPGADSVPMRNLFSFCTLYPVLKGCKLRVRFRKHKNLHVILRTRVRLLSKRGSSGKTSRFQQQRSSDNRLIRISIRHTSKTSARFIEINQQLTHKAVTVTVLTILTIRRAGLTPSVFCYLHPQPYDNIISTYKM